MGPKSRWGVVIVVLSFGCGLIGCGGDSGGDSDGAIVEATGDPDADQADTDEYLALSEEYASWAPGEADCPRLRELVDAVPADSENREDAEFVYNLECGPGGISVDAPADESAAATVATVALSSRVVLTTPMIAPEGVITSRGDIPDLPAVDAGYTNQFGMVCVDGACQLTTSLGEVELKNGEFSATLSGEEVGGQSCVDPQITTIDVQISVTATQQIDGVEVPKHVTGTIHRGRDEFLGSNDGFCNGQDITYQIDADLINAS
jgi:hypothetical protein